MTVEEQIRHMWPRAESIADIAKAVGLAPSTVRQRAKTMGLADRDKRGCAPTKRRGFRRPTPAPQPATKRIVVSVTDGDIEGAKAKWLEVNGGATPCPPAHVAPTEQGRQLGPIPCYDEPRGRHVMDRIMASSVAEHRARVKA